MLRVIKSATEDGTTKHTSEIQVTEFTFLSTKKGNENNKQIDSSESKNTNFDAQNNGLPINDLPF
jgi:single-strand DNA-binding protein